MRSNRAAALLVMLTLGGCAQVEAPSGGPEDRTLPRVVGIRPDSGAVGARPETLSVLFGKRMNRASVRDWTFISPPLEIRERLWKENRLDLVLEAPPESGKTYSILFGSEVIDERKNPLGPKIYAFSTGETLDNALIEGKVISGRLRAAGVYLYAWAWEDSLALDSPDLPDPLRMGQAGKDGGFRISNLPRGVDLRIGALYDVGRNRSYDPEDDLWGFTDTPVRVDDTSRVVSDVEIYLVLDDEPGVLTGTAVDSSCTGAGLAILAQIEREIDSLAVVVGRRAAPGGGGLTDSLVGFAAPPRDAIDTLAVESRLTELDSLRALARTDSARCATPVIVRLLAADSSLVSETRGAGPFDLRELEPATYRIEAFRDLDLDGLAGTGEPAGSYPDSIRLLPGRHLTGLDFPLLAPP